MRNKLSGNEDGTDKSYLELEAYAHNLLNIGSFEGGLRYICVYVLEGIELTL